MAGNGFLASASLEVCRNRLRLLCVLCFERGRTEGRGKHEQGEFLQTISSSYYFIPEGDVSAQ